MNENTIPHADLIRAVLDGKVVQMRPGSSDEWADMVGTQYVLSQLVNHPSEFMYRLKPEPVVRWVPMWNVNAIGDGEQYYTKDELQQAALAGGWMPMKAILRLELDPDTLAVISATTEQP